MTNRRAQQIVRRGESLVGTLWKEFDGDRPGMYVEVIRNGELFRREGPITDEDTAMMRIGEIMDEAFRGTYKSPGLRRRNY